MWNEISAILLKNVPCVNPFCSSISLACFWWWLMCKPKHVTFSTVKAYPKCRCDGQSFYIFVRVGFVPKLVKFLQVWTVSVWCQNVRAALFSPDCPLKLPNDTRRTFIKPRFTIRLHSHIILNSAESRPSSVLPNTSIWSFLETSTWKRPGRKMLLCKLRKSILERLTEKDFSGTHATEAGQFNSLRKLLSCAVTYMIRKM